MTYSYYSFTLCNNTALHNYFVGDILATLISIKHGKARGITHPLQLLVWQADAVLHVNLVTNTAILAKDRNALHLDTVLDNAG